MPPRWQCEQGHQWVAPTEQKPRACPTCGSRRIARADWQAQATTPVGASVADASQGDTLQKPTSRPPSTQPLPAVTPHAAPASLDETLAAPAQPSFKTEPPASKAPTPPQPAESLDETLAHSGVAVPSDHSATQVLPDKSVTAPAAVDETLAQPPSRPDLAATIDAVTKKAEVTDPDVTQFKRDAAGDAAPPAAAAEDEYQILKVLGRGGMGVVYQARQVRLNRLVALKMILAGAHASAQEMHRFDTEARAVAQLQHPNIVQIYDVGQREGRPFFALEFVEGGSLQDKLKGAPLPPRIAADLALQLARGVQFAHDKSIIHRDLKPANVLLSFVDPTARTSDSSPGRRSPSTLHSKLPGKRAADSSMSKTATDDSSSRTLQYAIPKITDFGLAKSLQEDDSQTHTGTVLGTPSYMSPEQAQGRTRDIGPAADIYSLGAIFYEMLTGRPPFRGESVMDTLKQVQETDPVPPRRLQPSVPRDLETICLKCLRKEAVKRYATAADLAEDLRRFLAGEPINARPSGPVERVVKWARRRPAVAALLAVLAVVLTGALFGLTTLWLRAEGALEAARLAKKDADEQKQAALDAEARATKEKNAAVEAEAKVKQSYLDLRHQTYIAGMDLAQRALKEGFQKQARTLLDKLKIHAPGEPELRGFEWFYLYRLSDTRQNSIAAHIDRVTQLALSSDSRVLITAGLNRTIKVWDTVTETELFPSDLEADASPLRSLACNGEATVLAAGDLDGTVFLWKVDRVKKTGQRVASFPAHERAVLGLAFSSDGKRLASAGADQSVKVWDVVGLLSSKDSASAPAPAPALELKGHKYAVTCVSFSPKDEWLASGSEDKKVILWNLATGQEERTYVGHGHWVSCVAFSPDGKTLASGSWDRTVRLWSVAAAEPPRIAQEHENPLQAVAFSPDGGKLASLSRAGVVRVWDTINHRQIEDLHAQAGLLRTVAFSADGQELVSIRFLKQALNTSPIFPLHHSVVTAVRPVGDSFFAASSSSWYDKAKKTIQGEIIVWDILTHEVRYHWKKQSALIRTLAVSKDGNLLASGSEDRTVLLLDLTSGEEVAEFTGHPERVLSVCFSPNGKLLASASEDGSIRLWDVAAKTEVRSWQAHAGAVRQVIFSPKGSVLASAGDDRKIQLWDVPSLTQGDPATNAPSKRSFADQNGAVLSLAFSKDGQFLVSGGDDQRILVRDLPSGKIVHELTGHNDAVTCLAFSPDGTRLASGSMDHTLKLWDPLSGQEVFTLQGHTDGVTGVAFQAGGNLLLSSSLDRKVRIWDGRE